MRNAIPFLALMLAGMFLAGTAHAQSRSTGDGKPKTYKWVDEKGVTHYGDSVPAEYSQREKRVLYSQTPGSTRSMARSRRPRPMSSR
jgi:hypothetical protein